ncbi:hypothetical protein GCM10027061_11340 [Nesterenkonia suensis]
MLIADGEQRRVQGVEARCLDGPVRPPTAPADCSQVLDQQSLRRLRRRAVPGAWGRTSEHEQPVGKNPFAADHLPPRLTLQRSVPDLRHPAECLRPAVDVPRR